MVVVDALRSTDQDAQAVVGALPPTARLLQGSAMNCAADALALAGLRRRHQGASPHDLGVALALQRIGRTDDRALMVLLTKETCVSDSPADFLSVALRAATICKQLGIPYLIGGGVASTVHGEFRTTRDIDLVVHLTPALATRFTTALATGFTVHPPDVREALAQVPIAANDRMQRATFAAYDRATGYQLDVFCVGDTPFDRSQLTRAITIALPETGSELRIASAEDTILTKLEWYAITSSDQQWRDVQTIVRVQGAGLDTAYLDLWANRLGIRDLWQQAERGEAAPRRAVLPPDEGQHQHPLDL